VPTKTRSTTTPGLATLGYASRKAGEPLGVNSQRESIERACQRLDLRLVEVVTDELPVGNGNPQPGLETVLERIDTGEVSCLVVSELERLTPQTDRLETVLDHLDRVEGRLVALDVGLDSSTETGALAVAAPAPVLAPVEAPAPPEPAVVEPKAPEPAVLEPAVLEPEPPEPVVEPEPPEPVVEPKAPEPVVETPPAPAPPAPAPPAAQPPEPPLPTTRMRALGYASVPADCEASGTELEAQKAAVELYCKRLDLDLVEVIREREPKTGKALDRGGLSFLIERIAAGDATCIVVSGLHRLSRSVAELGTIVQWLERNEVRLVAVELDLDTSTDAGRNTARAIASVAGWEHERLSERTRKGLAAARAKRHASGGGSAPDWESIRKRIATMRADGMTLQAIADTLNAEGVPTQRGGAKWRPSSVQTAAGYKRRSRAKDVRDLPAVGRRAQPPRARPAR
jgi:DNA invertase Pin-like site-specific DNA recombinase